ncbi:ABA-responsive family protein [Salix suchowensis]|nr:ABA-responsive family protein [Salix suchowensis]
MGSGSGSFLKVLLKNFDVLAGPVISLVYPLYASIRAIETKSHVDDKQWLTYWILYSMLTLFELTFAKVIELLPFWPYAKLILTCWLVVPQFSGAAYIYENFKDIFSKPDDVLTAAEKYIEENGTYALRSSLPRISPGGVAAIHSSLVTGMADTESFQLVLLPCSLLGKIC